MNDSTGGALLTDLLIIIVGLLISVFVASFAYTKAYRAKNLIIEAINDNNGCMKDNEFDDDGCDIYERLSNLGYRMGKSDCKIDLNENIYNEVGSNDEQIQKSTTKGTIINLNTNYDFCLAKFLEEDESGNTSYYYQVETRMFFDIPIFGFSIPVHGTTKSFRDKYVNIEGADDEE